MCQIPVDTSSSGSSRLRRNACPIGHRVKAHTSSSATFSACSTEDDSFAAAAVRRRS
jgi:hypothetical protein